MPHLHTLALAYGFINAYLLRQGEHSILIDTGNASDQSQLLRLLRRHGLSPWELEMLILTHAHFDHGGSAKALRRRYRLPIAMHPGDAGTLRPLQHRDAMGTLLGTFSSINRGRQPQLRPDIALSDGFSLQTYGIDAEIVHLPGHTRGSIGVLTAEGDLICGDTLMNFYRPRPAHIAEDFPQLYRSIARLQRLGIRTVYPGHGKAFQMESGKWKMENKGAFVYRH